MGRSHLQPARHFFDIQLANANGNGHHFFSSPPPPPPHHAISPLRLTPVRDDSTRVQLQRQRLEEQHATAIVSKTIPGIKTSAAFFASLRTNLHLHASPPPSPVSTPPSMRGSATSLPPPSPLSQPADSVMGDTVDSTPADDPLAGVPELKTYMTSNDDEKVAALKLVADSVAQMRQAANSSLIFHPLNLVILVGVVSLVAGQMLAAMQDTLLTGMTCMGVIMATLAFYRFTTQGYLGAAEDINWNWLGDADVLVTKFGEEIIGTIIVQWVSGETRQKRKKAWRGEIKAWTVRLKYRGKGVGGALLEVATVEAKRKGAEVIEFADDHANSKRVLPKIYNAEFDKREEKARALLADFFENSPGRAKRK